MIEARRCHSKYHQVLCRHEESGVMESPQTGDLPVKQPEEPFPRVAPGTTRSALSALHNHGASWQHPPPSAALGAPASPSAVPLKVLSASFSLLACASLRLIEPCPQWSELTWERITDALALRSAAWRRVRSTRSEEPATSFAFLQPLPSMGFQPITANEHSSGGGTNAF